VDHHLHVVIVRDREAKLSIAAGVVPQSSCSLERQAPALTISSSAAGRGVAFAGEAEIHRQSVGAPIMRLR
jgi:hypothetical protein